MPNIIATKGISSVKCVVLRTHFSEVDTKWNSRSYKTLFMIILQLLRNPNTLMDKVVDSIWLQSPSTLPQIVLLSTTALWERIELPHSPYVYTKPKRSCNTTGSKYKYSLQVELYNRCFKWVYKLQYTSRSHLEDGGSKVLRNTGILHYTASQSRRPRLVSSPLWKCQISPAII